jgi:hypothetical protein
MPVVKLIIKATKIIFFLRKLSSKSEKTVHENTDYDGNIRVARFFLGTIYQNGIKIPNGQKI